MVPWSFCYSHRTTYSFSQITWLYFRMPYTYASSLLSESLEEWQSLPDQFCFMSITHPVFFRISYHKKNVWNVLHWSSMHWLPHISFSQIPFVHLVCQDDWLITKALAKLPDSSAIIFPFRKLERITKRRIVSLKIPRSAVFWSQTYCYNFVKPPGEKVAKWREKILTNEAK